MSDSQWFIAVGGIIATAALLVGNAVFVFRSKQKSKRHRMESRQNLSAAIARSEDPPSPTSSSSANPWLPNCETTHPTGESSRETSPLPPDITQPEAIFLGITQVGPGQTPASISKSHNRDD